MKIALFKIAILNKISKKNGQFLMVRFYNIYSGSFAETSGPRIEQGVIKTSQRCDQGVIKV